MILRIILAVILALGAVIVRAEPAVGIRLEQFAYPFPTHTYRFQSQQQELEMVYMDVPPASPANAADAATAASAKTNADAPVVVLLHGKNFSGSYWGETATALAASGFRVVIPDQIGFGKSTKPEHYQFTFDQLAANTKALLESLGVKRAHVLGHSMGGMLATRYALNYPELVSSLTLVNPLGLEDWRAKGVPYSTVDTWYAQELKTTAESIRAYQLSSYYDGKWREAYDPWVEQLASFTKSPHYPRMAWNQALTYEMIFTEPVVQEFPRLNVPTLLIIGQRDRTALGKASAPAGVRDALGNYPKLGRAAKKAIHGAKLVELDGLGHLPQIEDFPRFIGPLREFLATQRSGSGGASGVVEPKGTAKQKK